MFKLFTSNICVTCDLIVNQLKHANLYVRSRNVAQIALLKKEYILKRCRWLRIADQHGWLVATGR